MNYCLQMKDWTVAATFAEAGDFETARNFIPDRIMKLSKKLSWFDKIMASITFAEHDMMGEVDRLLRPKKVVFNPDDFMAELGLKGCNYVFGLVSVDRL